MEDLLHKNIFNETELNKLSPDYYSPGFVLRLQARRSMVKDTHRHGVRKNTRNQRKSIHRSVPSDVLKVGKEIVKLRSAYAVDDLKNKLNLKTCTDTRVNKDIIKKSYSIITNEINKDIKLRCEKKDIEKQCKVNDNKNAEKFPRIPAKQCQLSDINQETEVINELQRRHKEKNSTKKIRKSAKDKISEIKDLITPTDNNGHIETDHKHTNDLSGRTTNSFHDQVTEHLGKGDDRSEESEKIMSLQNHHYQTKENVTSDTEDLQTVLIRKVIAQDMCGSDVNSGETSARKKIDNEPAVSDPVSLFITASSAIKDSEELNFLSVVPLRKENDRRREHLLFKKYIKKWRMYVQRRKETLLQQRKVVLDKFFDNLKQKKFNAKRDAKNQNTNKTKLSVNDYNTYQHRYKMQQHIIALQKAKLEEQTKIIEQLKFNNIIEASKQSVDDMREAVRKTYTEIDRHLRPKIKCLSNELKLHELQEPTLILHCLKVPQFLQRMEKRAREREEKHAIIRERRRQMEEERIRLKQQAELEKAQMDKEQKMRIMKELKEKRKREKIESIRKKQHAERMRALTVMADLHYERNLLVKYGIRVFVKLIQMKRDNEEKAKAHCTFQLKKNAFLNWMWHTEDMWFDRNYRAEDFRRKRLMRKVFAAFKQNHYEFVLKRQVAEDYYELYLVQLVFRKFLEAFRIIVRENESKMEIASVYYKKNLIFKIFTHWRTLPALNALERIQEARKARWRQRVLEVVPDYRPPED